MVVARLPVRSLGGVVTHANDASILEALKDL